MKTTISFLLAVCTLAAAAPDWPRLEQTALEFFQSYQSIPSMNPPGDTSATAAQIQKLLESHGIPVKLYVAGLGGHTNLLARLPGKDRSKKPLLLLNHMDVVPVDRKAWKMDPFAGFIQDGMIWGRGTMDMKGIGVQQIMALAALKDAGIVPSRDIVLLSTCDEETNGTLGIRWMIDNHFRDIDAEFVLDEGGFGTREILAAGKLVFGVAVGEKQTLWLRLHAKGTAAHGSQPIADNANVTLINALQKALAVPPGKQNPVVEEMVRNIGGPLARNKYTDAIQVNTISLTTLAAGVGNPPKVNVIPSASEATLDCRLLPGVNSAEFISEIKARINDPRVSVELVSTPEDPGTSSSRTTLFDAIRNAIRKNHPDAIVTPMLVPHGTDSVKLRMKGLIAYGLTPMVLDLSTAGSMHSDTEHIPVAEFRTGLHIYYDLLSSDF
ncbi:MAG: M20/M25/M40 family metallo-hydrolase [Bryobacteraceae bacterium]